MENGTDNQAIRETRDLLEILSKEIKESIQASSKLNKSILVLTAVMTIVVVIEFFTKVLPWIINIFQPIG